MHFKKYDQRQEFLLPPSLQEFVPAGHLAQVVNDVVEKLDLTALYNRYSNIGCAAYNPQMMLKVLFYGYATGERSSRVLAHRCTGDVAYMYLAGMQQPDFRTINRFRKDNIELLRGLFVQVVRLCKALGMISVGRIAIDGTKMKANASHKHTKKQEDLERELESIEKEIAEMLRQCDETDREEDAQQGEDTSVYDVPAALHDRKKLQEKLQEAKRQLDEIKRKDINLTDPQSCTMLHRSFCPEPSYNAQIAVEEKSGVIVAAEVGENPADYWGLNVMVEQAKGNTGDTAREVLADSGYGSYGNLEYLKSRNIAGYIPNQIAQSIEKGTMKNPGYDRSKFVYNDKKDEYTCPEGKVLPFVRIHNSPGQENVRVYQCSKCGSCVAKPHCTSSRKRHIYRNPRAELVEEMQERLHTEEGRKIYAKRKEMVESVFGDFKHNRNMRYMLLRGKKKASGEFLLMCISRNLRKIAKHAWGQVSGVTELALAGT